MDCGFYLPKEPVHSLGNRVWIDANNNGVADVGEVPAMEGIKLELQDANGKMLDTTTTNIDGRYLFGGLAAGSYQVCVVADNFAAGNILDGFSASTGGDLAAAIAGNTDGDDNGTDDISKGLCSNVVVLDDKQPLGEAGVGAPGEDGIGTDDARSNLTIDFGIVPPAEPLKPVSVGNYLWIDANEDGIQDKTESALAGATVTLLDAKGEPAKHLDGAAVDAITTGTDGQYLFDNLPAGDYSITVLPPEGGYVVTKGGTDADTDESNTDSNCAVVGTGIQTALFTLTPDAEPVDDGDTDASSNLSVDCGFYVPKVPVHSIGNMVWVDDGAGDTTKANDGLRDAKELAVPDGVVMELLGKDGKVISEVPTKDGYYLFSGLEAGEYSVCVAHGNFDQGLLKGYTASTGGDEKDITAGVDNSDNGENDTQDGLCSDVIVLDDKQPTGELPTASGTAGDDGMKTDDNRSNLTIDFGVLPPAPVKPNTVSVGDYIWIDTNKDGQQDADETGLAGATVTLMDKDGKPVVLDGTTLMPIVTGADGKYVFSNLPEGEYSISVAAPKDSAYLPTQGGAKVDSDPSNTDSNCSVDTGKTSLFTLTAGAEPDTTADGDGLDGNMTVDCGFYLPVAAKASISGTVSVDTTGDSVGETPLAGISLALLNKDGTPVLDKDGKPVTTLTDAKGEYVFADVAAGDYLVVETQPADYTSVMDGDTTSPEDDTANTDTTDDSIPVTVMAGETDDRNDFVERAPVKPNTVSVGDYIWIDANENGQQDAGEAPLAGATVTLMDKDGKPVVLSGDMVIAPITTGADGKYVFSNLPEGEYSISVAAPKDSGYLPTQGGAKVDTDPSNTDSNCSVDTGKTSLFTLTAGAEPDATADGDSTDGNMTVDCGFYLPKKPMHSIGNMVWVDNGEGTKASNGKYDQGETLPSAVQVELRDATGTLIRSTQTDKGFYLFNELEAGAYKVCVAGSNFNEGAVLAGYTASDIADETDANDGGDNNDNGDNTASDGLCSNLIVLDDKEPKGETPTASGTAGDDGMATDDNRSNLTVDFAVVPVEPVNPGTPVSVGNQIWVDSNADGKRDEGESLLAGAVVTLTDGSGRAVTDLDGAAVASHTTGNDGLYVFSNLPEGEYIVTVEPPEGFFPTVGGIDADTDASDFDSNCRVNPINTTIETHPFTLTAGAEPDADGDDTNGNMTVDCGFYGSVSLGNKIWQDDNANGQQDNAEPGIAGITISLMEEDGITPATDISGNVVAGVKTDASGNYLFENLKPGNYIVVVNPGKDSGYSLTKGGADPDADTSNTDSNCKVVAGTFQTPAVTLLPGSEPAAKVDGDDESRNSTVDCGLFRPVNLGSRLWIDLDNNGKQDGGEPGVPGATVTLLTVDGKPVTDIFGDVLKPQTTDADGKYFFGSLREGQYVVKVIPPAGYLPTVAVIDPNNNDGTDSNGVLNADGSIVSKPIDLKWGDEPADGGATNTTVGFGLIANLHVPTLSQWGVAIMSMLLATAAFFRRRRED
ncbi:MAG: hypothetical protein BWK73_45210 [Thiothrix lacustris]|uniref:IPTL-CTERM protein sorting domain-containing protein n=1 Tax=Thiothrix lacustris TaxID=525917 RepID=A0A1Y1QB97_9GAMM|nr:MAG: hypothetical protein BWK73_45210 [Thiothrix lacustris]